MTTVELAGRVVLSLTLGLAFGSFLTVLIARVPAGESLVHPRSRCPSCGTPIRGVDNIPVVSWIALRGRCHACGARISALYPLIELATGVLFVAVALRFEDIWLDVILAPFLGILLALSVIDARTKKIPNRIVYPTFLIGAGALLVARLAGGGVDLLDALIGLAIYGGALMLIAFVAPRGMGMGDVKLAGLIGMVLGALGLTYVAVAAGLGILFGGIGAVVALVGGADRKHTLPFGPYLAGAAIVATFAAPALSDAYLNLLS